jgi:hypothetical protein
MLPSSACFTQLSWNMASQAGLNFALHTAKDDSRLAWVSGLMLDSREEVRLT